MLAGTEGGVTRHMPDGEAMTIFDAAERYAADGVPLVIVAGADYGVGLVARLGGQGHATAGRARGDRRKFRAHPSLEPDRHGRAAAAVPARAPRARPCISTAAKRSISRARGRPPSAQDRSLPHHASQWRDRRRELCSRGWTPNARSSGTSMAACCRTRCVSCSSRARPDLRMYSDRYHVSKEIVHGPILPSARRRRGRGLGRLAGRARPRPRARPGRLSVQIHRLHGPAGDWRLAGHAVARDRAVGWPRRSSKRWSSRTAQGPMASSARKWSPRPSPMATRC